MFCRMIVRERAFGPRSGRTFGPSRSATTTKSTFSVSFPGYPTKNGGKIWIFVDRQKGFSKRPKKVHFWKIQFQKVFQKSKNRNFAAIFVYIEYMNGSRIITKIYYNMQMRMQRLMNRCFYRSAKNLPWALRAHVNESFSQSTTKELLQMICGKITLQMIDCK